MCRRMPELPSIKQQSEACYRKIHELIYSDLNVTRSRAVCIETDVNCCKELNISFVGVKSKLIAVGLPVTQQPLLAVLLFA